MKMKKIVSLFVLAIMVFAMTMVAFATPFTPSVAGDLLETDIKAYINSCQIDSYNVNGSTAVFAEDLGKYGLLVDWNEQTRTVNITKSNETEFSGKLVFESENVTVGKKVGTANFTDIRTIVNGVTVLSYNINGKTAVLVDSLKLFGSVSFDGEKRKVICTIPDLTYKPLVTVTDPTDENEEDNNNEIVVTNPDDLTGDYYSNGYTPNYGKVTGAKFIQKEEKSNDYISYTYDNYDEFMADKYITHIVENEGFSFGKTDQKENVIIYYYTKGENALAIEIDSIENTLTLTCKK